MAGRVHWSGSYSLKWNGIRALTVVCGTLSFAGIRGGEMMPDWEARRADFYFRLITVDVCTFLSHPNGIRGGGGLGSNGNPLLGRIGFYFIMALTFAQNILFLRTQDV